jgi:isopenicillin-N epimerase
VKVLTPLDSPDGAGICLVSVEGIDCEALGGWLHEKHRIITTPIKHAEFSGLRVTPNVYTTIDEIDLFAERMLEALQRGIA